MQPWDSSPEIAKKLFKVHRLHTACDPILFTPFSNTGSCERCHTFRVFLHFIFLIGDFYYLVHDYNPILDHCFCFLWGLFKDV